MNENDIAFWFLVARFTLAGIALFSGAATVYIGFQLFLTGHGAQEGKSTVTMGTLKIAVTTVGTCVIAMSVPWGMIGYWISPTKLAMTGSVIELSQDSNVPMSKRAVPLIPKQLNSEVLTRLTRLEHGIDSLVRRTANRTTLASGAVETTERNSYMAAHSRDRSGFRAQVEAGTLQSGAMALYNVTDYWPDIENSTAFLMQFRYAGSPVTATVKKSEGKWGAFLDFADYRKVMPPASTLDELVEQIRVELAFVTVAESKGGDMPDGWDRVIFWSAKNFEDAIVFP